jgi:hypothetical protein
MGSRGSSTSGCGVWRIRNRLLEEVETGHVGPLPTTGPLHAAKITAARNSLEMVEGWILAREEDAVLERISRMASAGAG